MSIKMVDLQVLIPKVQEVAKTQQIQQQGSDNQQASTASQLAREAKLLQSSVQETPRSEEGKIREREEEQNKKREKEGGKGAKPQENAGEEERELSLDPRLGKKIDIMV